MTSPHPRTADLIRQLARDALEAEGEGQAWEAAACRACVLYLEALQRAHAREAWDAGVRVLDLLVKAGESRPSSPSPSPSRPPRGRLH